MLTVSRQCHPRVVPSKRLHDSKQCQITFFPRPSQSLRQIFASSDILTPLSDLLCADQGWVWGKSQQAVFCTVRGMISEDLLLSHYFLDCPLLMSCDASVVGIGAVLQQPDGKEVYHPVAYVPRKLTDTERRCPQIEREALAIAFGAQKFHQYLLGHSFTLLADHRPLVTLLGAKNCIPQLVSMHIKCWALLLSAFKYIISKENVLADYLSRALLPDLPDAADFVIACEDIKLIDEGGLRYHLPRSSQLRLWWTLFCPVSIPADSGGLAWNLSWGWPETLPCAPSGTYYWSRLSNVGQLNDNPETSAHCIAVRLIRRSHGSILNEVNCPSVLLVAQVEWLY